MIKITMFPKLTKFDSVQLIFNGKYLFNLHKTQIIRDRYK